MLEVRSQEQEDKKFDELRSGAEILYRGIKTTYCPYLKEDVHFSREGIEKQAKKFSLQAIWKKTKKKHLSAVY